LRQTCTIEHPTEDQLKALGAAAASSGSVGLFHVIGVTPEAPTRESVFGLIGPQRVIRLDRTTFDATRSSLSTSRATVGDSIDAVAIGSPHLSADELQMLDRYLGERQCTKPLYACTGRHTLAALQSQDLVDRLTRRGVVIIADTCIVVTPILPKRSGVLVTNSGKFAHYTPTNTGYEVVFASLADCIESAVAGSLWLSGGVAGHGS
jgi:predicted aconitase